VQVSGRWWVAHTRPRAEKALASDLARLSIFHYLPLYERVTRSLRTNRRSRSLVPVFSGYLFFAATEEKRSLALKTNRIVNLLTVADQAQLVAELRHIQRVLESDTSFLRRSRIQVGQWVRITAGPLAGVEGVVSHWRSSVRLYLNVNILGQSITVETPPDVVEPIDPPTYAAAR
jgi:transcriptional antiterminator RfaH